MFPRVLKDYSSPDLSLANPDVYRDLARPIGAQVLVPDVSRNCRACVRLATDEYRDLAGLIGAQQPAMRAKLQERYETWCDDDIPAFHYGTLCSYMYVYDTHTHTYTHTHTHTHTHMYDVCISTHYSTPWYVLWYLLRLSVCVICIHIYV